MTYNEFLTGTHMRPIPKCPGYFITNKSEVYSSKTGKILKGKNVVGISLKGKLKYIKPIVVMLKVFHDVEFTRSDMMIAAFMKRGKRGVYSLKNQKRFTKRTGRPIKQWYSLINIRGKTVSLGSFYTKEEAYDKFYKSFLMLRGCKPW